MSEGNGKLPEGWAVATLDELCELNPKHDRELPDSTEVSFVPMAAVSDTLGEITAPETRSLGQVRRGYTHFAEGDVLWAKITPCMENGKSAVASGLVNGIGCGTTEFFVLRPRGAAVPEYLHRFMRQQSYREAARASMQSGVGQARVPKEFVAGTQTPLPPLAEQRRIVAKIEELQTRTRRAREALEAIPPLLERFRQSVLAAAFRGDLTADWRARNPDVEPASVLLERIRAERRRKWEEAELKKMRAKGKMPKGDHWKQKYQEPALVDASGLPGLPEGWCWERIGLLSLDDIQTGPFGAQLHRSDFVADGVPVLAIGNVKWGCVDLGEIDHVTPEKATQLSRYILRAGDVLFTRSGTVGRAAVLPSEADGFLMTGHILRIRVDERFYLPDLLFRAFRGEPTMDVQLQDSTRGATRAGFNTSLLANLLVPVPPSEEQREILTVLQKTDGWIQRVQQKADCASTLDMLDQSILLAAFRGELVPQDPTDEPASVLLERIRAERTTERRPRPRQRAAAG